MFEIKKIFSQSISKNIQNLRGDIIEIKNFFNRNNNAQNIQRFIESDLTLKNFNVQDQKESLTKGYINDALLSYFNVNNEKVIGYLNEAQPIEKLQFNDNNKNAFADSLDRFTIAAFAKQTITIDQRNGLGALAKAIRANKTIAQMQLEKNAHENKEETQLQNFLKEVFPSSYAENNLSQEEYLTVFNKIKSQGALDESEQSKIRVQLNFRPDGAGFTSDYDNRFPSFLNQSPLRDLKTVQNRINTEDARAKAAQKNLTDQQKQNQAKLQQAKNLVSEFLTQAGVEHLSQIISNGISISENGSISYGADLSNTLEQNQTLVASFTVLLNNLSELNKSQNTIKDLEITNFQNYLLTQKNKYNLQVAQNNIANELANNLSITNHQNVATRYFNTFPVVATNINRQNHVQDLPSFNELALTAVGNDYGQCQAMINAFDTARSDNKLVRTEIDLENDTWFKNGKNQLIGEFLSRWINADDNSKKQFSNAIVNYLQDSKNLAALFSIVQDGGENYLNEIIKAAEAGLIATDDQINKEITKSKLRFTLIKDNVSHQTVNSLLQAIDNENYNAFYDYLKENDTDINKLLNLGRTKFENTNAFPEICKASLFQSLNTIKNDVNVDVGALTNALFAATIQSNSLPGFDNNFLDKIKIGDNKYAAVIEFSAKLAGINSFNQTDIDFQNCKQNINKVQQSLQDKLQQPLKNIISSFNLSEEKLIQTLLLEPTVANLGKSSAELTKIFLENNSINTDEFFLALKSPYSEKYDDYLAALKNQVTARLELHAKLSKDENKKLLKSASLTRTDVARLFIEVENKKNVTNLFNNLHKNIPSNTLEREAQYKKGNEYKPNEHLNKLFQKDDNALIRKLQKITESSVTTTLSEDKVDYASRICENYNLESINKLAKISENIGIKEYTNWEKFVLFIENILGKFFEKFSNSRVENLDLQKFKSELNEHKPHKENSRGKDDNKLKTFVDKISKVHLTEKIQR